MWYIFCLFYRLGSKKELYTSLIWKKNYNLRMNSCLIILVIFIRSFRVILFFLIRNERLNLFLGTIMSGLFVLCCCCGRTRYDEECDGDTKFCSFVMNCVIGLSQFATIILCLVGWCWSIGWGITLISVSSKFLKA